ncbi:MAG: hypothetical protein PGMFKBFP_02247 [Anaerolineales bacterium]|nr:hypothetical protein [Anaerolineales bacterium]
MFFHSLGRQRNFLWRRFLRLLCKAVRQDQQSSVFKEAEQAENVIARLDADFPNLRAGQLFEILDRDNWKVFDQTQNPF